MLRCNLICERFLKNIARFYGRTLTGARSWKGSKNDCYDDRVYDFRVAKNVPGSTKAPLAEEYSRCTPCNIVLLRSKFTSGCPCCGNTKLTRKTRRGGRESSYNAVRY